MQEASDAFYRSSVTIGNYPFIEFAGLMNEYITACRAPHNEQALPLHPVMSNYINEKLECIFSGAKVLDGTAARGRYGTSKRYWPSARMARAFLLCRPVSG